jgi:hypothetical protein
MISNTTNLVSEEIAITLLQNILMLNDFENDVCTILGSDETKISSIVDGFIDAFMLLTGLDQCEDFKVDEFFNNIFSLSFPEMQNRESIKNILDKFSECSNIEEMNNRR